MEYYTTRPFDSALVSNDMSLDRVLGAGLPVALLFHDNPLAGNLRPAMDELARQYAGKALFVMLARSDAPQAISRFGVRQMPAIVTVHDGKTVTRQQSIRAADIKPHVVHLLGDGPAPNPGPSERPSTGSGQTVSQGPLSVNESNFEREVLRADRPVLVDFWAPWCGPCHMVAPALEAIAREHAKAVKVTKVNVDENPGLASRYGAMSIPTMVVVKDGREVDRWVGAMPERALRSRVARWIQARRETL